ncbi:hypothetical protein K504DRAFT_415923 [Pleomassaria siparia CBS 279.74]|uniref:Zn(2)-C6 fungal-type domain-containing protein n=1 Tax=Pleomassaria siparia CBS 279.74 TaxID=1314801 RepID=A0A6G1JWX4_9PLEO|nr:hypothetical protein K504DRAFT_415923 [Pleomassaria siparia CBS 279.74]
MEDSSSSQQAPSASGRKKAACAECRQQKMRCDGDVSAVDPPACSRCHRLKIPCVFSAPFRRTHKRKRLEELEQEASALKNQLLSASPAASANGSHSREAPRLPQPRLPQEVDLQNPPTLTIRRTYQNESSNTNSPTLSRAIEGLELVPGIIDDCFSLYFRHYHSMLPILDPDTTPNTLYQDSPFLFWLVISIGCRRYTRLPTLLQGLALPVTQLALQSVIVRINPIARMKGLILLVTWPFPSGPFYRDPCYVLGGTLLHMAMQCGLHVPTFSQDFAKRYHTLPEQEPVRRAELWAYVVITYQRTCSGSAQANLVSLELYNEQPQLKALLEMLPTTIRVQFQISDIITRAQKALLGLGLHSMTPQQERAMDALLKGFGIELDRLDDLASSIWDRLYIQIARQDLIVMYFYKSATTLDVQSSISIFEVTSKSLEMIRDLDKDYNLHRTCTRFLLTNTILSLSSLARILKGPFADYLDHTRGFNLFDAGVKFAQSCSVQRGDYGERGSLFADQLWKSTKAFRNPDGSINITLRVRNRLSGGPLHDVVRCWREEFTDLENMHSTSGLAIEAENHSSGSAGLDTTLDSGSICTGTSYNVSAAPELFLNNEIWGDLGLGLTDSWDMAGSSVGWMA